MVNTFCDDAYITSSALLWEELPKEWKRRTVQRGVRFLRQAGPGRLLGGGGICSGLCPLLAFSPVIIGSSKMSMGLSLDLSFEPMTIWGEVMTTSRR